MPAAPRETKVTIAANTADKAAIAKTASSGSTSTAGVISPEASVSRESIIGVATSTPMIPSSPPIRAPTLAPIRNRSLSLAGST